MKLMCAAVSLIIGVVINLLLVEVSSIGTQSHHKSVGKESWGYAEVRSGAFMFWWLYYANDNYLNKPLVIWLQGGPGASSTGFGNFMEIGPLDIDLKNRSTTWVQHASLLFIDNPVGSGFSYVNDPKLLATNNTQISIDLVNTIDSFLQKIPEFQTIPIHIFSESYGGKMAAQFSLRLYKAVVKGKLKCNLKSVNLGDSWISPIDSVLTWAPYLYSTSLVDHVGYAAVNKSAYLVKAAIEAESFKKASQLWDETEEVVSKATNGVNFYNILQSQSPESNKKFKSWRRNLSHFYSDQLTTLMNGKVKEMLRVIPQNVSWGSQSRLVFDALSDDFMRPVTKIVSSLLNSTNVTVNVYNGQLDLIVDTMGTINWVENLSWNGIEKWKIASRAPLILNNSTEGYLKTYKNFAFYWILKAGHMVPTDAPETGLELLKLVIRNSSK